MTEPPDRESAQAGLNPASAMARLLDAPMRSGTVTWIGLRPERRQPLVAVALAELDDASGLAGDHYHSRTKRARQITIIQAEHIADIAGYLGSGMIDPGLLRRNFVVAGINLRALGGRRFRLGSALCEHTGECHPCSRMEEALGPGGYNAVRGHGGITARVVGRGEVRLGDEIARVDDNRSA